LCTRIPSTRIKQQLQEIKQLEEDRLNMGQKKGDTKALIAFLEEAFSLLDPDGDGSLPVRMLVRCCTVDTADEVVVKTLFEAMDSNHDNEISLKEFCEFAFEGSQSFAFEGSQSKGKDAGFRGLAAGSGAIEMLGGGSRERGGSSGGIGPMRGQGRRNQGVAVVGGQGRGGQSPLWNVPGGVSANSFEVSEVDGAEYTSGQGRESEWAQQGPAAGAGLSLSRIAASRKQVQGKKSNDAFRTGDWLLGPHGPPNTAPGIPTPTPAPTPMHAAGEDGPTNERSLYLRRQQEALSATAQRAGKQSLQRPPQRAGLREAQPPPSTALTQQQGSLI
jgi:hypothetical protein